MNHCTGCGGASVRTEVVPEYDADILGAPFKVYLRDAVKVEICTSCEAVLSTTIPDPEGLFYAVSFERALHPRKLVGAEIKFLRNVMGWKAKKLADELGITAEHLSRCESGRLPLSMTTEKLLRLYVILQPGGASEAKFTIAKERALAIFKDSAGDLIEAMNRFKIEAGWKAEEPLVFHFERRRLHEASGLGPDGEDGKDGKWKPEKYPAKSAA